MATNLKATFVGAALAALAAGVAVPVPAARSEPTDSSADTSLYSYERDYAYTDPDGLYGNQSEFGHDLEGNCIGWQCDSE